TVHSFLMPDDVDVIVVGSGPSGAQAAQTLVEQGCTVTLLDVGLESSDDQSLPAGRSFVELRHGDPAQHNYFLGPNFEGVPLRPLVAAPQVTPPRRHVIGTAAGHVPIEGGHFAAIESHALGGLGSAWGAVSFPYLDLELERSGLVPSQIRPSYERIARRIGICGARDDLTAVRGPLEVLQPPLIRDHNATGVIATYARKRKRLQRQRLYVGDPMLAALSIPQDGRAAHAGHDLDFWANPGDSVYRPEQTIRALQRRANFSYQGGWRVESFAENDRDRVVVTAVSKDGAIHREFRARRLVLAAGALGTTRIVLRSLQAVDRPVPLVCNAHLYVPCIHLRQLGKPHAERCHSLAQLTMIYDPTGDRGHLVQAQMYSYRSLLLFRLLKEAPLPQREALWIMRGLAPSFVVWAIEHEDEPSSQSFCRLRSDGVLEAVHPTHPDVEQKRRRDESAMMRGMRRLGCWPIRRVHSGPGSSLHYGGQFPPSELESPLTTDGTGRLRNTRAVHIVDGAALRYLPAKGLTLTLMANADRVALAIAAGLRGIQFAQPGTRE
ncbi:MAG TPA: hypothetical protein VL069_16190, partial [Opitutus sp.]|nr:hypothetical protein [Opitutus sp.]